MNCKQSLRKGFNIASVEGCENVKSNIINKLTIQFNQHLYEEDEIYFTIGIKFGFSTNEVLVLPQNEIKKINQASGEVFINYIDIIMKDKYKIYIRGNVKTGIIYISMKTRKNRMDDDAIDLLKTLYEDEVNEGVFNRAKEIAKDKFSYNYKNINFRAYYNMMEFSNINKNFILRKLTKNFLDINVQELKEFIENIVVVQNSILFINGDLSELNKSKIFKFIENIKIKDIYVRPAAEAVNKYLQTDVHIFDTARENVSIGGINFNFFNDDVTILEKQLLLSILSEIMFKDKGKLLLDEFDNSLLYFNSKLEEYSTKIFDYLNEESVIKAKDILVYKLSYMLDRNPYLFNKYCIDLYSKGIDFSEYIEVLKKCDSRLLKNIYIKGNLKITEGHLLYVKER
ncbi:MULTISPECIES: hypothetical protein [Clostridium]|uniref:Uncharacterized protein n=1 Tax=Clostridium frigoriphilum TaxID=443253 RepID=A0ABU7UPD8_9CLOT|nr:hypothetical protein [Clostridium sp. DSM 17811]MBU3099289.1 hypothetical protein [Clostridium sp. DSM 17811]